MTNNIDSEEMTKTIRITTPSPIYMAITEAGDINSNRLSSLISNLLSCYYGIKLSWTVSQEKGE